MIVIVDYKVGNIGSVQNMIKKIGSEAIISSDQSVIGDAEKLILPGVGAFDSGMTKLKELGLIEVLHKKVMIDKIPILGICLGMQLLTKKSEEGQEQGLGFIDAETLRFKFEQDSNIKVPHMGWNYTLQNKESKLFHDMFEEPKFYFVHSFYVKPNNENDTLTKTKYGIEYTSSVERENVLGVQFHPEKSHKYGMKLLKNFIELY